MNRNYWNFLALCLAAGFLAVTLLPAVVQAQQLHLELMNPFRDPIPPDGSQWHELYPNFCDVHTQDAYEDNGDGEVSACDAINLVNAAGEVSGWHITWAGPTYMLVPCGTGDPSWYEPTDPQPGGDPTCETWVEIWPNHGQQNHIDNWEDNGNGVLDACDNVWIAGVCYHIEEINLDITIEPGPVPAENNTWGEVKSLY